MTGRLICGALLLLQVCHTHRPKVRTEEQVRKTRRILAGIRDPRRGAWVQEDEKSGTGGGEDVVQDVISFDNLERKHSFDHYDQGDNKDKDDNRAESNPSFYNTTARNVKGQELQRRKQILRKLRKSSTQLKSIIRSNVETLSDIRNRKLVPMSKTTVREEQREKTVMMKERIPVLKKLQEDQLASKILHPQITLGKEAREGNSRKGEIVSYSEDNQSTFNSRGFPNEKVFRFPTKVKDSRPSFPTSVLPATNKLPQLLSKLGNTDFSFFDAQFAGSLQRLHSVNYQGLEQHTPHRIVGMDRRNHVVASNTGAFSFSTLL